jgi:phenylpyruvate tautomerase PptA (4-oxalocrotonate tautomerase family)
MPFPRIDLLNGKTAEHRAAVADVVYKGIVDVLKAPEGDRFMVIGEHSPENLIYDQHFLDTSPLLHARSVAEALVDAATDT